MKCCSNHVSKKLSIIPLYSTWSTNPSPVFAAKMPASLYFPLILSYVFWPFSAYPGYRNRYYQYLLIKIRNVFHEDPFDFLLIKFYFFGILFLVVYCLFSCNSKAFQCFLYRCYWAIKRFCHFSLICIGILFNIGS